jgi:hypothetical protein
MAGSIETFSRMVLVSTDDDDKRPADSENIVLWPYDELIRLKSFLQCASMVGGPEQSFSVTCAKGTPGWQR